MIDPTASTELRDYFAAKAMEGILSSAMIACRSDQFEKLAKLAYEAADAMLKQRNVDRHNPSHRPEVGVG